MNNTGTTLELEAVETALRTAFPNGHPSFIKITLAELALHDLKNHDYASGGDPLGNFKRVGAILGLYPKIDPSDPRVVSLIFLLKQLDAALWGLSERIEHKVEGLDGRLGDVSIYGKIGICLNDEQVHPPSGVGGAS